ncbi:hypothetical protein ACMU_10565 [Actibacterium mucosum KCTC 23349]|uniref:DUF1467 family protein n=1 Tax=Actibacterium mucosum KCTC 23349 TaxID=1454373 RepID=A0A037ZMW4_9RHOB|nr:DUF1467 family protein [Actibacterium mucosum]KAJ56186.1 hypothetical protein ACMU_10565 [Actibacterium mucosum KCTC 23349]
MGVTSAMVLFAVIWFMVLFVVLPLRLRTQGEEGDVVKGTHASAPANFQPRRTALIVTGVAAVIWAVVAGTIWSGVITMDHLDKLNEITILKPGGRGE